jgi:arylsulfatase A-like enzyme
MRFWRASLVLTLLTGIALASGSVVRAGTSPGIVVILADDAGWGDVGVHGHPTLRTPALDSLARDGARFDRFYVQPVCAPTRAEFLTGRWALRAGVTGVDGGAERLPLSEQTIAEVIRAAGYATGCFGKWHNGGQYPYHPNGRGFDEFYGFTSGHWGSYFSPPLDHNGEPITGRGYLPDDLTDRALDFIQRNAAEGRPFLAYVAFNTPHSPMQVPDAYWEAWEARAIPNHRHSSREDRVHTRAALAMVENLDANVGRLLAGLDALGLRDDTIVVYFSDNGPNGWRWNGDLKGRKGSTDEGGVRSPLFIRWPRGIAAGTRVSVPTGVVDLRPTLTALAGIIDRPRLPLDGVSRAPELTGRGSRGPVTPIFATWRDRVSVRQDRFLLDENGDLYDLATDPGQTAAVTAAHPQEAAELRRLVTRWREDVRRTAASTTAVIPVGHPAAAVTMLPAGEATLHGGLQRSNRYPNDSYVRHWHRTSDRLSWDIEVIAAGRFEVVIQHTAEAAGAHLEVRFGSATASGIVPAVWNPPERGGENDRVPREESPVKDFRPLSLGPIDLPAGRGALVLSAPVLANGTAIDFQRLILRRLP